MNTKSNKKLKIIFAVILLLQILFAFFLDNIYAYLGAYRSFFYNTVFILLILFSIISNKIPVLYNHAIKLLIFSVLINLNITYDQLIVYSELSFGLGRLPVPPVHPCE